VNHFDRIIIIAEQPNSQNWLSVVATVIAAFATLASAIIAGIAIRQNQLLRQDMRKPRVEATFSALGGFYMDLFIKNTTYNIAKNVSLLISSSNKSSTLYNSILESLSGVTFDQLLSNETRNFICHYGKDDLDNNQPTMITLYYEDDLGHEYSSSYTINLHSMRKELVKHNSHYWLEQINNQLKEIKKGIEIKREIEK